LEKGSICRLGRVFFAPFQIISLGISCAKANTPHGCLLEIELLPDPAAQEWSLL
jgi:hypothetical protein